MIDFIIGIICGILIGALGTAILINSYMDKAEKSLNKTVEVKTAYIKELVKELFSAMKLYEEGIKETIDENIALKKKLSLFQ